MSLTLYSTDTIGVLKPGDSQNLLREIKAFYRYNWSIETIMLKVKYPCQLEFYRYNWSIETAFKSLEYV